MQIIVGLGNPGAEYAQTRHNIGFMVVEQLSRVHSIKLDKKHRLVRFGEGKIAGKEIILAQPLTFMNNSGTAIRHLLAETGAAAANVIVIYDDLDLDCGRIRVRANGGSGGHKGIKSIMGQLGTDEFARVRIGIGRPPGRQDSADYVLSPFSKRESEEIDFAIVKAADAVEYILEHGIERAMNEFNRREAEA